MCELDLVDKTLKVVEAMFEDVPTIISKGMKHSHSNIVTVLRDGKDEYSPSEHRRDCFDMMLHFDLYVKKTEDGMYMAGKHGSDFQVTATRPTVALVLAAFNEVS